MPPKPAIDFRNIEEETLANHSYRRVLYTVPRQFQLVLMSLESGETIPREVHESTVQFFRVESGRARVTIDDRDVYMMRDGDTLVVPPGTPHFVENATPQKQNGGALQLYTIYTPPEHPPRRHQRRQP